MIKRKMTARGWGYAELAEALKPLGIKRSTTVLNRRINRGNFAAGFLLACLHVLEHGEDDAPDAKPDGRPAQSLNATKR